MSNFSPRYLESFVHGIGLFFIFRVGSLRRYFHVKIVA